VSGPIFGTIPGFLLTITSMRGKFPICGRFCGKLLSCSALEDIVGIIGESAHKIVGDISGVTRRHTPRTWAQVVAVAE
jgi:hypothetical protein